MRLTYSTAIVLLFINSAGASCPADACYAVTFNVLACEVQPSVIVAPDNKPSPEGVLLKTQHVTARAVPCFLGAEGWKVTGKPEIESERSFFYRSAGYENTVCIDLKGKKVTLFAPALCCDTPNSCPPTPARELEALPLSAQ